MDTIKPILNQLLNDHPDVKGCALIKSDGTPLTWVLPEDANENKTSIESAAILSLGNKIGQDLIHGQIESLIVQCDTGYAILTRCESELILVVITELEEMENLPFSAIKKTCTNLSEKIKLVTA